MAHIVTSLCVDCKHTDCVEVCPVDCFHEDEHMVLIDPYECIDCAACIPVCPEEAIFHQDNLPPQHHEWIKINADRAAGLPVLVKKKAPLAGKASEKKCKKQG